jgi:hypothetical protein
MSRGKHSFCVLVESFDSFGSSRVPFCAVGVGGVAMSCTSKEVTFLNDNLGMGYYSR